MGSRSIRSCPRPFSTRPNKNILPPHGETSPSSWWSRAPSRTQKKGLPPGGRRGPPGCAMTLTAWTAGPTTGPPTGASSPPWPKPSSAPRTARPGARAGRTPQRHSWNESRMPRSGAGLKRINGRNPVLKYETGEASIVQMPRSPWSDSLSDESGIYNRYVELFHGFSTFPLMPMKMLV